MGVSVGLGRGYGFALDLEELDPEVQTFMEEREYDEDELYEDSSFIFNLKDEFPGLRFDFTPSGNYERTKYLIVSMKSSYSFNWSDSIQEGVTFLGEHEAATEEQAQLTSLSSDLSILPSDMGWVTWVTMF